MSSISEKKPVLLACQSSLLRKSISKLLEHQYDLIVVEDAESAWRLLAENRQIVMVLAEQAIALERFALVERIRQAGDERLAATPVLLLFGQQDSRQDQQKLFRQGASDFVMLPPTRDELTHRVALQIDLFLGNPELISADNEAAAAGPLRNFARPSMFESRVSQELAFSQRHRSNLSICHLKIDGARSLAEQYGKDLLQDYIKSLINVILRLLRTEDLLSYQGNAVFQVLYPATNGIGAMAAVKRIQSHVASNPVKVDGQLIQATLSASVYSCVACEDAEPGTIFQRLTADLQKLSAEGKNRLVSSHDSSGSQALSIDRALKMLEQDSTGDVDRQLERLLLQALPLYEYADASLDLDLLDALSRLRKQLNRQVKVST